MTKQLGFHIINGLQDAQAEYYKSPVLNSEYYISALEAALIHAEDRVQEQAERIEQLEKRVRNQNIAFLRLSEAEEG